MYSMGTPDDVVKLKFVNEYRISSVLWLAIENNTSKIM